MNKKFLVFIVLNLAISTFCKDYEMAGSEETPSPVFPILKLTLESYSLQIQLIYNP